MSDIIDIAESWLSDIIEQTEVAIDWYKTFQKGRLEVKVGKGGGVILYVKKEMPMRGVELVKIKISVV
jgi:hypothetical protein